MSQNNVPAQAAMPDPNRTWDLVVVGGGITGAGVLNEASRRGLKAVLIDQGDFGAGTSSKSSKMIHGGLRYLSQGQFGLIREAAREREKLLSEIPGLVSPLVYAFAHVRGQFPPQFLFRLVLLIYDLIGGRKTRRFFKKSDLAFLLPRFFHHKIKGASCYEDAVTEDSRLVMRTLMEARASGGEAFNYIKAISFEKGADGSIGGLVCVNQLTMEEFTIRGTSFVNSTGAWADVLRMELGHGAVVRPLRGSHIVIPSRVFPISYSMTFFHPQDGRPIYVFPWYGQTVIGTTDLDHEDGLKGRVRISQEEVDYLLEGLRSIAPPDAVKETDILSTFSGIRLVIRRGHGRDPSKEKRTHSVYQDHNLITVTGGKLTTFRAMALEVVDLVAKSLPKTQPPSKPFFVKYAATHPLPLDKAVCQRLQDYYGPTYPHLKDGNEVEWEQIEGSPLYWSEIRHMLRYERVVHLDDLMLRRTRLGLTQPKGGAKLLDRVGALCRDELGWSQEYWRQEVDRYLRLWMDQHGLPGVSP